MRAGYVLGGAVGIYDRIRATIFRKYDDEKFWRIRHELCHPEGMGRFKHARYIAYYERENRRSAADIALGWDDEQQRTCENFSTPPNITAHGINGIVIAGGQPSVGM